MTVVIGGAVRRRSGLGTAVAVVALLLSGCVSYDPNPTVVIDNRTDREVLYQTDMPDSTADGRRHARRDAAPRRGSRLTREQGHLTGWTRTLGPWRVVRDELARIGLLQGARSGVEVADRYRPSPPVMDPDEEVEMALKHRLHLVEDGGWKVGAAEC